MASKDILKEIKKKQQENKSVSKALQQSLYRQALGEKFITDRVIDALKHDYSTKEVLYRYYDHAERGTRQVKIFNDLVKKTKFKDALVWQDHVLEISDCIGAIAICFRAVRDYKENQMQDMTPCLLGKIGNMEIDDILHEIANGFAHVRSGNNSHGMQELRMLNESSAGRGLFPSSGGPEHHESYSTIIISDITDKLRDNFDEPQATYFDLVIEDVLTKEPNLKNFAPYIVEKP